MNWDAKSEIVGWRWMLAAGALAALAATGAALSTGASSEDRGHAAVDRNASIDWPAEDTTTRPAERATEELPLGTFARFPPVVEQGPMHLSVRAGGTAMFFVRFEADPSWELRWERNGATVHGADRSVIVLPAVTPADQGSRWRLRIRSADGEIVTEEAVLSVDDAGEPLPWE